MRHDQIVAFGEFGVFEVVAPGLCEIVDTSALDIVSGGKNYGCKSVGPFNGYCYDQFCGNSGCVQVGCGNDIGC